MLEAASICTIGGLSHVPLQAPSSVAGPSHSARRCRHSCALPRPCIHTARVQAQTASQPVVQQAAVHDTSPSLRQLASASSTTCGQPTSTPDNDLLENSPPARTSANIDSALQTSPGPANELTVAQSFEGISAADSCPAGTALWTADPSGAVGPNNYLQSVNFAAAIYDKSGNLQLGPFPSGTFWNGMQGACGTGVWSDAVVLYDHAANRWFASRFAKDNKGSWNQCIAVSTGSDPTGSYYRYAFLISQTEFNDYPKFGIWPDAYYMTANRNKIFPGLGVFAVAFDRNSMLAGQNASSVVFTLDNNGHRAGMLPADWDGPTAPPAGTPNFLVRPLDSNLGWPSPNTLEVWQFHVDWTNPNSSTLTLASSLTPAPYNSALCNLRQNCIPEPGTTNALDTLAYGNLMYRLAYRNFGDHQALVLNQTVDAGDVANHAAIRWYELRRPPGGAWSIFQQSSFAPDANDRWMGSIAMDSSGNIATGYSVSGGSVFPSIRVAGQLAGDPLNQLSQESSLVAGKGAQTGYVFWGDWSQMTVDPNDDCTLWYVSMYYPSTVNGEGWNTRISALRFPTCQPSSTATVVTAQPGWNLVSRPAGTVLQGAAGSLYTFQATDTNYESFPASTPLKANLGYWAYFPAAATFSLNAAAPQTTTVSLPANHYLMVGNPTDGAVNLSGADVVFVFNAATGQYANASALVPGQGAWVFSRSGGMLTLTPDGS